MRAMTELVFVILNEDYLSIRMMSFVHYVHFSVTRYRAVRLRSPNSVYKQSFVFSFFNKMEASRIQAILDIKDDEIRDEAAKAYIRKLLNSALGIKLNDDLRDSKKRIHVSFNKSSSISNDELCIHVQLNSNKKSFQSFNEVFIYCLDDNVNWFLERLKLGLDFKYSKQADIDLMTKNTDAAQSIRDMGPFWDTTFADVETRTHSKTAISEQLNVAPSIRDTTFNNVAEASVGEQPRAIISNIMKLYTFENSNRAIVDEYILKHIEDIYKQRMTLQVMGENLGMPYKGRNVSIGPKPVIEAYNAFVEYEDKRIKLFPKDTRRDDNTRGIMFSQAVNSMLSPFINKNEEKSDISVGKQLGNELSRSEQLNVNNVAGVSVANSEIIEIDFNIDEIEPIEITQSSKCGNSDPEYVSAREWIGIYKQFATMNKPLGTNCSYHIPSLRKYINIYQVYVRMLDEPRYSRLLEAINRILINNGVVVPNIIRSYKVVDDVVKLIKFSVETNTKFEDIEYFNEKGTCPGTLSRALIDSGYSKAKWMSSIIAKNKLAISKAIEEYRDEIDRLGIALIPGQNGQTLNCLTSFPRIQE